MINGKKVIEPVVYSLLLEYPESNFLSIQYAYTLEEALYLAREEYDQLQRKISGNLPMENNYIPKLTLFVGKSVGELTKNEETTDELFKHYNKMQEKKESQKKEKQIKLDKVVSENNSNLMKEIIDKKDLVLFKKNMKVLSSAERLYVRDQLK